MPDTNLASTTYPVLLVQVVTAFCWAGIARSVEGTATGAKWDVAAMTTTPSFGTAKQVGASGKQNINNNTATPIPSSEQLTGLSQALLGTGSSVQAGVVVVIRPQEVRDVHSLLRQPRSLVPWRKVGTRERKKDSAHSQAFSM